MIKKTCHIKVLTNNTTTVAYLNYMGGTFNIFHANPSNSFEIIRFQRKFNSQLA